MKPYHEIFPKADPQFITLEIPRKTGRIPKGNYRFLEQYCTDPGDDCRQLLISAVNEKSRPKANIRFSLDAAGAFTGPYLDPASYQSPYAADLAQAFTDMLNARPEWLQRIQRRYQKVRELADKKPYAGKPFPKPGDIPYQLMPPPELEAVLEESLKHARPGATPSSPAAKPPESGLEPGRGGAPDTKPDAGSATGMQRFVDLYAKAQAAPVGALLAVQEELRRHLLADPFAGEELAALLPPLCRRSPQDDEKIDAALRLLRDMLDFYQVEIEGGRGGARRQMERFQGALARRVMMENQDVDLSLAVVRILSQSRVEPIAELRDAEKRILGTGAGRTDLQGAEAEDLLTGIARSLKAMGVSAPFEGADEILKLSAASDPELRAPVISELMTADDPFLREIATLMLFHPDPAHALEVSRLLVSIEGCRISPETLRRLIIARNWFPIEIRRNVDQAITNARKARVECAPLPKPPALVVYASGIDGSGAQRFQVLLKEGAAFCSCSIVLQEGNGVADSSVNRFTSRAEKDRFIAGLTGGFSYLEQSSPQYLDLRVCQALADGVSNGVAPNHWFVRIAELFGRDRWKGTPLDAGNELLLLRDEIDSLNPALLEESEYLAALEESGEWPVAFPAVLGSWAETGDAVGREVEAAKKGRGSGRDAQAIERVLSNLMEPRRDAWLDRLVVDTLWLRQARNAPLNWQRMYHVAQAVADRTLALKEIPLMSAVARWTVEQYRAKGVGGKEKGKGPR
ncbi:hypothetical protein Gbem_2505 [Citrifermentans bemidjiense Bem]|uniref:Uncharacterized protein n=1 Tax=Citrifermentans bemidjiense (strain ATCC BAA-1014 / DSM 16622 / JCM 12645 / Bem) TaxID=404380 RepID=B5EGN0_CITBB|nr:hypothetical protein [Citrifermentans bemidjiense]ACH39513.1 hypothetical protein Gbem_2505 [Citrifermentans bemidjiense Bem]